MRQPKLEYEESPDGKWRFVIKGGNGEVQMRSEWYDSKSNAVRGVSDLAVSIIQLIDLVEIGHPEKDAETTKEVSSRPVD